MSAPSSEGSLHAGGQPLLRGPVRPFQVSGVAPVRPCPVGGWGGFLVWFGTGWVRLLPVRDRGRAGGDSSLQVSPKVALRLLGRCGDTPGTPPSVRLAGASLRGGRGKEEVGVTPVFFSPPPCRSAERCGTGACRGVPAATQQPERNRGGYAERGVTPEGPRTQGRQCASRTVRTQPRVGGGKHP